MMDIPRLPMRALIDTGVFLRFLGDRPTDPEAPLCKAFCDAMIETKRTILVAAPTLAEVMRFRGARIPRQRGIAVVPFDDLAAEMLALNLPMAKLHETKSATGLSLTYLKYDAMIVACALRGKADRLITLDVQDHTKLAALAAVSVEHPRAFVAKPAPLPVQADLFAQVPAAPKVLPALAADAEPTRVQVHPPAAALESAPGTAPTEPLDSE